MADVVVYRDWLHMANVRIYRGWLHMASFALISLDFGSGKP